MNFCVTDFLSDQFFLQEEKVLYLKLVPPLLLCFVLSSNDQIQETTRRRNLSRRSREKVESRWRVKIETNDFERQSCKRENEEFFCTKNINQ